MGRPHPGAGHPRLRWFRVATQLAVLAGTFAVIFLLSSRYIVCLSPLHGLLALLAGSLTAWTVVALAVLLATALAGRWFCGWLCPVGTLQQVSAWVGERLSPPKGGRVLSALRWKYLLLLLLLPAAALGVSWAGAFDPLSFLPRTVGVLKGEFGLAPGVKYVPTLAGGLAALALPAVLAVSAVHTRWWCRHLCPLGALLGASSVFSLLRIRRNQDACDGCNVCSKTCQHGCIDARKWVVSECNYCLNCTVGCPQNALHVGAMGKAEEVHRFAGVSRRAFVGSLGAGLVLPVLLKRRTVEARGMNSRLLRPPGALGEQEFVHSCTRCGACEEACPMAVIRPSLLEAGVDGFMTPRLDFSTGYCKLDCMDCAGVCHSGAIQVVDMERRKPAARDPVKVGLATIVKDRCLPWAYGLSCITCNEFCPTSPKAIKLVDGPHPGVKVPQIDPRLCTGCGACEFVCPLPATAALVTCGNETRNPLNRATL